MTIEVTDLQKAPRGLCQPATAVLNVPLPEEEAEKIAEQQMPEERPLFEDGWRPKKIEIPRF